jgi:hypothetical protein
MPKKPLDVTKPLVALSEGLDEAFNNGGAKQLQVSAGLIVVACFLRDVISPQHADTFFELSSAFGDLTCGAVHPWLASAGKKRDSSQLWRGRANAVIALEALNIPGTDPKTLARELIRKHSAIGKLGGGKLKKRATFSTLLQWQKDFSSGRVKNFEAQELFSMGREFINKYKHSPEELRRMADRSLRAVSTAASVFTPASNTP